MIVGNNGDNDLSNIGGSCYGNVESNYEAFATAFFIHLFSLTFEFVDQYYNANSMLTVRFLLFFKSC